MKKDFFKRGTALALSAAMAISLLPVISPLSKVDAATTETEKTITGLGIAGIGNPYGSHNGDKLSTTDSWKGSYVYYGKYDGEPIKYRVLDTESRYSFSTGASSMLLQTDKVVGPQVYSYTFAGKTTSTEQYSYADSSLVKWMNETGYKKMTCSITNKEMPYFLNGFSSVELNGILASTKTSKNSSDGGLNSAVGGSEYIYTPLNKDKVFALDVSEYRNTHYGYPDTANKAKQREQDVNKTLYGYFIRSTAKNTGRAGAVGVQVKDGVELCFQGPLASTPAFNLNKNNVLFTSLVSGTAGQYGAAYKFTILDPSMELSVGGSVDRTGNVVTVPYSVAGDTGNQISYLVTDKAYNASGVKVLAYGKAATASMAGDVRLNLASIAAKIGNSCTVDRLVNNYKIYLVIETISKDIASTSDIDESLFTDYASKPVQVSIPKAENEPDVDPDGPIIDPDPKPNPTEKWKGNYVWFGSYKGEPLKFRVLDTDSGADFNTGNSYLLEYDSTINHKYNSEDSTSNNNVFKNEWMNDDSNGFLETFTSVEKSTIVSSTKTGVSATDGAGLTGKLSYEDKTQLKDTKVFALSVGEATNTSYGYPDTIQASMQRVKGTKYNLRSNYAPLNYHVVGSYVTSDGQLDNVYDFQCRTSPAMNINKDAVLFTNLVAGKAGTYGAEYKLTLLDDGMTTAVTETPSMSGNVVTIPYKISGTNKKSVNQLSYLVTDKNYNAKNANILAYGKLEDVAAATLSGTTKLDLAAVVNKIGKAGITTENIFDKYKVYIVAEEINVDDLTTVGIDEGLYTNYASEPTSVSKPVNTSDENLKRVETPTVTVSSDKKTFTLATKTAGATIYYTTDGSDPGSKNGTKYTGALSVKDNVGKKITMIAVKSGMKDSYIAYFTVKEQLDPPVIVIKQVDKPTAKLTDDKSAVILSTTTEGADIYYTTDGTTPSKTHGKKYIGPFSVLGADGKQIKTVKAVGVKANMKDSDVREYAVESLEPGKPFGGDEAQVGKPSVKASDDGTSLIITADPKDADIYYTTDGSTPSKKNGTKYTGPIPATDKNGKTIDTIKVIGVKDNMKDSDIATVKVADLKTQKPTIAASSDKKTITVSAVKGATIYYTTDGSTPSKKNGKKYTGPIDAASVAGKTIKAIATLPGKLNSDVVSAEVSKLIPSTPVNPVKGQVAAPTGTRSKDNNTFTLATKTAGATIYYTTNGSYPTTKYGTKYTKPFTIKKDSATTITAIAVKNGMEDSDAVQFVVIRLSDGKVTVRKEEVTQPGPKPGTKEADKWVSSDKVDKYTKGQLTGRASATTSKVTLRWERLKEADGYIIYGNYCNKKNKIYKYKKIKTVSASKLKGKKNISYTLTKLAGGKKFKKNTFYKFKVIAYKNVRNSKTGKIEKRMISKSFQLHTITATKKYKYNNPIGVTVKNTKGKTVSKVTVKKRKSVYLDATVKMAKNKKLKVHCEKVRWISTNSKIATVSQGGRIKGKKKGTCYVYALAQNGARKKLKITVK